MDYKARLQATCQDLKALLNSQPGTGAYLAELNAIESQMARREGDEELKSSGERISGLMRTLATIHAHDGKPLLNAERHKQFKRESLFE
jgi:hypothetical protein